MIKCVYYKFTIVPVGVHLDELKRVLQYITGLSTDYDLRIHVHYT